MIKMMFRNFTAGFAIVLGYLTGVEIFNKLKSPVTRAAIKRKFKRIKDAITSKEEA